MSGVQNSMNTQGNSQQVFNQTQAKGGPKAVPLKLDFSVQDSYLIDLSTLNAFNTLEFVQTVFVDNADNSSPVIIYNGVSQQRLVIPANSQGYYPFLCPNPGRFTIATDGGVVVNVELCNFPVSPATWSASSNPPFLFDDAGNLLTSDATLAQVGLTGNALNVAGAGGGGGSVSKFTQCSVDLHGASSSSPTTLLSPGGANPRFLMHSAQIQVTPGAYCTSGTANYVTIFIFEEGAPVGICAVKVWLPGTAPALVGADAGLFFDFDCVDVISNVDNMRLRVGMSEDVGDSTVGGVLITCSAIVTTP